MSSKDAPMRKRVHADVQAHIKEVREKFLKEFSDQDDKLECANA